MRTINLRHLVFVMIFAAIFSAVTVSAQTTPKLTTPKQQFGFNVAGAACLVERLEAGGRPAVEKAAAPAQFISVFTSNDVKAMHLKLR